MDEDEETAQLLFLETSPQSKRRRTLEETEVEQLVPSGDGLYETVGSSPRLADKDDSLEEEDSILFAIASPVTCSLLDATPVAPASLETDERPPVSTTTEISLGISFSALWAYLLQELTSSDLEETGNTDLKAARVKNFLRVPKELEKLMFYGFLICLDSFLYVFTILPARFVIAIVVSILSQVSSSFKLRPAQKCDLMKGALFLVSCLILSYIDASQLYHSIRGQAVIKLYVIFNLLDVLNRLGSAFGHDILDSLFSKATVTGVGESSLAIRRLNRSTHFLIAIFYVFAHSMILFYQMIALNVAVNSYSNSLLPIMLSSNFVEIKSSVFKKCDDRNLFNITCADILERFQLCAYLFLILIRNFLEMTGGAGVDEILSHLYGLSVTILTPSKPLVFTNASFIPMYFGELAQDIFIIWARIQAAPEFKLFITLLFPAIYVIGSELIADLLKHAFITKFNEIPASIYTDFKLSLFRDLAGRRLDRGERPKWESQWEDPNDANPDKAIAFVDRSPIVARRIGFVALPLSCLFTRIIMQTLNMLGVFQKLSSKEPWIKMVENQAWLWNFGRAYLSVDQLAVGCKLVIVGTFVCGFYLWLVSIKLVIGIFLLRTARRYHGTQQV